MFNLFSSRKSTGHLPHGALANGQKRSTTDLGKMVDIRSLTDEIAVAPQIVPDDVAEIARQGYRVIINNRPDGEEAGQPDETEIRAAAHAAGLVYYHQPVISGALTAADVAAFADVMHKGAGPVLAFCRSGTRCTTLWALASARLLDADDIIQAAQNAGYDLSGLRPILKQAAAS